MMAKKRHCLSSMAWSALSYERVFRASYPRTRRRGKVYPIRPCFQFIYVGRKCRLGIDLRPSSRGSVLHSPLRAAHGPFSRKKGPTLLRVVRDQGNDEFKRNLMEFHFGLKH